jgi:hypothetical protein
VHYDVRELYRWEEEVRGLSRVWESFAWIYQKKSGDKRFEDVEPSLAILASCRLGKGVGTTDRLSFLRLIAGEGAFTGFVGVFGLEGNR